MAESGPDRETDHGTVDSKVDSDTVETTDGGTTTEESEWQFGLDEVGPDGVIEAEPEPLEPGQVKLENVVFVLVGIVGTLLLLLTVV